MNFINALLNKKKYKGLSWFENFMGGHIDIGPITIHGENAMHWGVQIRTKKWGFLCFRLPVRCFGSWFPLYFYASPNATPWASTFHIGDYHGKNIGGEARSRREKYGHNFDTSLLKD